MDLLCIDSGNTRIKWRVVNPERGLSDGDAHGQCRQTERVALVSQWAGLHADAAICANVAGAAALDAIRAGVTGADLDVALQVVSAQASLGVVKNPYADPGRLGADRWAALIAAAVLYPAQMLVIASLGTATTVDVLLADGRFEGGIILPGVALMRAALSQNTAALAVPAGHYVSLATNTPDAIESGIWHAQCGAIARVFETARKRDPAVRCLITGGDATLAAPLLPFGPIIEDNLVLRGLVEIARLNPA